MGFRNHSGKGFIYSLVSSITYQSHDRKRQSSINFPITYQSISSLGTYHFFYGKSHIMVIVSYYDNIMGIMGNAGSNRATTDSIAFYDSYPHLSRILMSFDHCNFLILPIRSKIFSTIFFHPWNIFQNGLCHDLFLLHLNHSCLCSRMFQFQTFFTETRYMDCIFQVRRTYL